MTALRDVRVFDGQGLTEPCTVVIAGAVIGADATGAKVVDTAGGVLLPGLIDAHIHPDGRAALAALTAHGVTTGLSMATWPAELVASMRDVPGLTDLRSAGSARYTPRAYRSWPAPTPTPRPASRTNRRSARACTTSWHCWSTRA